MSNDSKVNIGILWSILHYVQWLRGQKWYIDITSFRKDSIHDIFGDGRPSSTEWLFSELSASILYEKTNTLSMEGGRKLFQIRSFQKFVPARSSVVQS